VNRILKIVILLFILCPGFVYSQTTGKISGRVYDQLSGDGLIGANIIVSETQTGSSTDQDGNFTILRLFPGVYTLEVTYVGYAKATIRDVRVYIDRTTFLEIPLQLKDIELDEVVVTAQRPVIVKDKTFS